MNSIASSVSGIRPFQLADPGRQPKKAFAHSRQYDNLTTGSSSPGREPGLRFVQRFLLSLLLLLPALGGAASAEEASPLTQRDWMAALVNGLGWSFGLPDEPQDVDYLRILSGDRTLRVEAEEAMERGDRVSVKNHRVFGTFSGEGWVSGIATPTVLHLRFLLPLSGAYRIKASLRLPGHEVRIGAATFSGSGDEKFQELELGEAELPAGLTEAEILLPPNGGIDYLELTAPPLPPVRPLHGWQLDRPVTYDDLAVTAARVLDLEDLLPPAAEEGTLRLEAEESTSLHGARVVDDRYLGIPSGGRWVRAGNRSARVDLAVTPSVAAVHEFRVQAAGPSLVMTVDGERTVEGSFPLYLQALPLTALFLEKREVTISFLLPPRAGLDFLELMPLRSTGRDYRRLIGLPLSGDPAAADLDRLLALLAPLAGPR